MVRLFVFQMQSYKRKMGAAGRRAVVGYSPSGKVKSGPIQQQRSRKKRRFQPGRDRSVGYYGRYEGGIGELKFHDVSLNQSPVAAAGNVTASINLIPQGVREFERNGRKCTIQSVLWRLEWTLPEVNGAMTPAAGDTCRMILYQDKQTNGATAAATDILETATMNSFRNLVNTGRFVFLVDKTIDINYIGGLTNEGGVFTQSSVRQHHEFYLNTTTPLEFNGVLGIITEIRSNNYGVLLITQNGVASFQSSFRLRFQSS